MKKNAKKIFWIGGIIILLIVLGKIFGGKNEGIEVNTELSSNRDITETVAASGKIQPETEVKIQSEVSGQIVELPVKEGDIVKQGQLLVKINPDLYTAALNRAEAALNSARSNLSSAKARLAQSEAQFKANDLNYQRQKKLFEDAAISKAELDNATSTYETSKAEVVASKESINSAEFSIQSAQASVNEASDNLKRTTILAPMTGTVTALNKELGETVLGNSMMSGDVIMKVSALEFMEVNVEVNESDIVRVNVGDTAIVEVDSYKDEEFKGLVTEIGNTALNALSATLSMDQVTNFSVKIRVLPESYKHLMAENDPSYSPFKPGMSATVDIVTDKALNVLSVPIKCVASREDTSSMTLAEKFKMKKENGELESTSKEKEDPFEVVFILNESTGKAEIRVVETGIQDDKFIEIKKGINSGELIITGPYEQVSTKLKTGDKVKKKTSKEEDDKPEEE
jgi:HlyD family secretion protein